MGGFRWGWWSQGVLRHLGRGNSIQVRWYQACNTALPWSMCYGVRILQPLRASLVTQSKARQWWKLTSDGYCRDTGRGGGSGEESTCRCRRCKRHGFHPWVGKIPWRRNGNPLQYTCLENPMDRGAWRATAHQIPESDTTHRRTPRKLSAWRTRCRDRPREHSVSAAGLHPAPS